MKERPILFSGEMTRAILDGRKTQTRRVVQPGLGWKNSDIKAFSELGPGFFQLRTFPDTAWTPSEDEPAASVMGIPCPYGKPGDLLYVRESFWIHMLSNGETIVRYAATEKSTPSRLRPAIHMPRSASRLTLEITEVRVERLQDISERDAWAEGFHNPEGENRNYPDRARYWFRNLWDSLNGKKHPWESNPWVWVVSFRRVEG